MEENSKHFKNNSYGENKLKDKLNSTRKQYYQQKKNKFNQTYNIEVRQINQLEYKQSIHKYQKQIRFFRLENIINQWSSRYQSKMEAFSKIKGIINLEKQKYQNLMIQQQDCLKEYKIIGNQNQPQLKQLIKIIQQRDKFQRHCQKQFLRNIKDNYFINQREQIISIYKIVNILNRKVQQNLGQAFHKIQQINYFQYSKINLIRIITKIKLQQFYAFHKLNQFEGFRQQLTLSQKQKLFENISNIMVNAQNRILKKVMWTWYLLKSNPGNSILESTAQRLVLFTNIHKYTAFYRLFQVVKNRRKKIPHKYRKILTITHFILRNLIDQSRRECFTKIKVLYSGNLQAMTKKFLESEKLLIFKKCKLTFNAFIILEQAFRKASNPIFYARVERARLIQTLSQIGENLRQNQRFCFNSWRGSTTQAILLENTRDYQARISKMTFQQFSKTPLKYKKQQQYTRTKESSFLRSLKKDKSDDY